MSFNKVGRYGEAQKLRAQARQRLELAKTGVERAIATDEAMAIAWINQQLKALELSPLVKVGLVYSRQRESLASAIADSSHC